MPPISLSPQSVVSAWIPRRYKKWRPWGAIFITCHSSRPTIPKFMNKFKGGGKQLSYLPFLQLLKQFMNRKSHSKYNIHKVLSSGPKIVNKLGGGGERALIPTILNYSKTLFLIELRIVIWLIFCGIGAKVKNSL